MRDAVSACCRVRAASPRDLEALAPLFDAYRQFYGQPSAPAVAEHFLRERMRLNQSMILLAESLSEAVTPIGFVQLYPLFSSTRVARTWLLNDLFVCPSARGRGAAQSLMMAAAAWAKDDGAIALSLSTAHDNLPAQRLYEKLGWARDLEFREYTLQL